MQANDVRIYGSELKESNLVVPRGTAVIVLDEAEVDGYYTVRTFSGFEFGAQEKELLTEENFLELYGHITDADGAALYVLFSRYGNNQESLIPNESIVDFYGEEDVLVRWQHNQWVAPMGSKHMRVTHIGSDFAMQAVQRTHGFLPLVAAIPQIEEETRLLRFAWFLTTPPNDPAEVEQVADGGSVE